MASQEYVRILRESVEDWNEFVATQGPGFRANLANVYLEGANLPNAYLFRANLEAAELNRANLSGGKLSYTALRGAKCIFTYLQDADLRGASLKNATLIRSDLTNADLRGADLSGADLTNANLFRADLRGADLRGANLTGADATGATLDKAILTSAILTNATFFGASLEDADLRGATLKGTNFQGATLTRATLRAASLENSSLDDTLLQSADIRDAVLRRATLKNASLQNAIFDGADLIGTNLEGANLQNATLLNATLKSTTLASTNLTGCQLGSTLISTIDLSTANGLASLKHQYPSPVSTDTLDLSNGRIPDSFLKGCGLADWEILNARLYDPDLSEAEFLDIHYEVFRLKREGPVQINPVFLSYSHKDDPFVDELQAALNAKGIRSWRDKTHAEVGPLEGVIDRAIRLNPTVLLVLSKSSVRSGWVKWEIEKAGELEEKLGRPVICPVAIDDAWLTRLRPDLRSEIKRYAVLDLSEDGAIEREMPRILKGLQIHYRDREPERA